MRREERVTVRGPVKEQQPDGMSHLGEGVVQGPSHGAQRVQAKPLLEAPILREEKPHFAALPVRGCSCLTQEPSGPDRLCFCIFCLCIEGRIGLLTQWSVCALCAATEHRRVCSVSDNVSATHTNARDTVSVAVKAFPPVQATAGAGSVLIGDLVQFGTAFAATT